MQDLNQNANLNQHSTNSMTEVTSTAAKKEIVFIDATVADKESLVAGVKPGTEVIILDSTRDGVAQITEVLANRSDIASVHIVSHGAEGSLQLGASAVNSDNLQAYSNSLQQWASAFTADADILLYGCDVASGGSGEAFVQQLSQLTGADVAASDDLTGSAVLGGDWDLETKVGVIEAALAFQADTLADYNAVLPTTVVTQGNSSSAQSAISADGRYVTFLSFATNLVSGDTNNTSDIFVYDRQTNTTSRVSVDSNGTQGNLFSREPAISADGRYVTFTSFAINLVSGDTNNTGDIFVYDRQTNTTSRVSVDSNGTQGNNSSNEPAISADGRYVTFLSFASNLVSGDTNNTEDIFVYDRQTNTTSRVSVDSNGTQGNKSSFQPAISADGRYVTFLSFASNLVSGDTNNAPDIFVNAPDIFVYDRQTNTTSRVSVDSNGNQGNNSSREPAISADGRYVTFTSNASNLVSGDTNNAPDIFVYERNVPPAINLPGAAVSYTENAAAIAIDSTATASDVDSANFDTGTLTVSYTTAGIAEDQLLVGNIGNISVSGTTVLHSGTAIGTITSDGSNGSNLVINLNASATPDITQELLRNITYSNSSENPTASRTVQFILTDGDGGTSTAATKTINVTAVNDAPNFTAGAAQNVMANSGAQTVTGWATNFNPGTDESTQTLDRYIVNVVSNAGIFEAAPTIDTNGNLTFTPVANIATSTTATIEVRAKDNGGTANGGVDTSVAKTFNITVNPQPKISISDVTITEGDSGIAFAEFQVSLSNASTETVSVNYATANNTAIAGSDYTATNDTLTFAPGVTTQTFRVAVNGDTIDEANESFFVNLSNPSKATIIDAQGIGNIIDNDTAGFTITPISGNTSEAGGTASFSVKLNSKPTADVTLSLASSDTTEGTISNSKLTFTESNWNDAQTVTVKGVDDTLVDGNIAYRIVTNAAVSADAKYNNLNPVDVSVVNINDNDIPITNVINGNRLYSDTLVGTAQNDQLTGYRGHDTITGGLGSDRIYGNAGSDALYGDMSSMVGTVGGDDLIWGGSGSDRIYGGYGHDSLYGGVGNDQIWGDAGRDRLSGGLGSDSLTGGAGRDTFVLAKGEGVDTITDFQMGRDFIGLAGGLSLGQVSITQRSSQAVITNNSDGEILAAINNINAATLQSNAASTFVTI